MATIVDTGEAIECSKPHDSLTNGIAAEDHTKNANTTENGLVSPPTDSEETVDFKLIFNKQKLDVTFPLDSTVTKLKAHIESLVKVPASMQKIMYKGRMQDEKTLREHNVVKNAKIMIIGSTVDAVLAVATPDAKTIQDDQRSSSSGSKDPLCKQKSHKTVLEKYGKPDDALPAYKDGRDVLPHQPLTGMLNKIGGKVRLTFKLESDQLWIGTKERTEKLPMGSIKNVVSEAIESHPEYHIMGIQTGPTELSRYWIYWVPAQYIDAIKDAVLGKWQSF